MAEEIGELAHTEEDVLMYALFPNEARDYLQRHQAGAEQAVFMTGSEIETAREDDSVNVNQIRELVKLVEESDVTEIVVEEGDVRIAVRRGGFSTETGAAAHATCDAATGSMPPSPESAQVTDAPGAIGEHPASWKPIVAPMVGTFYAAGSPGAAAFVAVGDTVAEGQTLCILEAMKLMNEITADEAGVIREVAVSNAAAVEYGTVLFYYEPVA
jgi:oxaloacetate decarboxylase alpha subunit